MAFAAEAQAETVAKFGPLKPYLIEIIPGAMSAIIFGIKKGLKRGISLPAAKFSTSFWKVSNPPIPDPQITPTLDLSTASRSNPASWMASSEATIAYCVNRSILRASFLSKCASGSKFLTSHAN